MDYKSIIVATVVSIAVIAIANRVPMARKVLAS